MNSGAEAVETVIKAVRKWGYQVKGIPEDQAEIIVCADNFHGRTITIVGFSTDPTARSGFGPFTPGFKVIPFGDADALEAAITPNTAGFLVEPIQGEAGVIIPPDGYLKAAREICDRSQCGADFGRNTDRTGPHRQTAWRKRTRGSKPISRWWARHFPAVFIPYLPCCPTKRSWMCCSPASMAPLLAAIPLACAIARTAIRVLKEEKMIENAQPNGRRIF
jgi:ornithine--oxo-acid transaminase